MQKDQSDWQSIVPETDNQKEATAENFPPRGIKMADAEANVVPAEIDIVPVPVAKKPLKSAKNNRLDSKNKYVPFNQSYKSSHEHTFMKVSDIHEGTERFNIMVKVTKQYFYRNSQNIDCTQVTLSDSSGSAWGYFVGSNCRYFIQGSILCIIDGTVRIYNNRISLQLNKNSQKSQIYQSEIKNIETNTKYNISHRIIEDRYQYRQWPPALPPWQGRGNYRKSYHRPYYQYAQPQRRNSISRSSSRNSNRSSFHKNIRRDNERNNYQFYKPNNSRNSRNQSKRRSSYRQDFSDKFQNQKRCNHMCDCSKRYEKSRKKQYIQKSIQRRSRRYDKNQNQKPRSYHSYLLNKSSVTSFNKTINDDAKNDSIQVKIGNSSTIVSALASPRSSIIYDPLPKEFIPTSEKKDHSDDSIEVEIINETLEGLTIQ